MGVSIGGETVMDTMEMWSKAQFPTMIPLAVSLQLLIHPNQPTRQIRKTCKNIKGRDLL